MDTIQDQNVRGGLLPFIVVILFPEHITEKKMIIYNDLMNKIVVEYKERSKGVLKKYSNEIIELYKQISQFENVDALDSNYTMISAADDFKNGIYLP